MPFQVTLMLADAAQAIGNKLYILGGGWSVTGPEPSPSAIAIYVKVPWDQTNRKHKLVLVLVDSDGDPVRFESPDGLQPITVENEFEVGRPPGVKPGTPLEVSMALTIGPLHLPPGRFEWRLQIGDEAHEHWTLPFEVRANPRG